MDRVAVEACPLGWSTDAASLYPAPASDVGGARAGGTRWSAWRYVPCRAARLDRRPAEDELGALYDVSYTKSPSWVEAEVRGAAKVRRAILNDVLGYSLRPAVPFGLSRVLLRPFRLKRAVLERSVRLPCQPDHGDQTQLTRPGRLLDLGCGNGAFLLSASATGWDAAGIDIEGTALAHAAVAGVDARCEPLEDQARRYDGVTLSHVVEHLADPVALLRSSWMVLRPGGPVRVAAPNLDADSHRRCGGRWIRLDVPRHLVFSDEPRLREAPRLGRSPVPSAARSW